MDLGVYVDVQLVMRAHDLYNESSAGCAWHWGLHIRLGNACWSYSI